MIETAGLTKRFGDFQAVTDVNLHVEPGEVLGEPAVRDALIVPETKPLDDLLTELQRQRSSMGVVVDEYGRTVGIVTVEDILEEVVGEIEDETDPLAGSLRQLSNGRFAGWATTRLWRTRMRWIVARDTVSWW